MDKYIGRLLDNRYEILEIIGTGGMAVVYKARCHRLNRLVAIKILRDEYSQDEEFRRRFHAESQAVAMLSHPNIVSVYDVSTSDDADYIVMELIDGITLKQYMEKKGVLNWKETLHFAIQIAKALDHAHSRGIIHRDIKPHNVMVLKNGSVKVADFGIARVMSKSNTLTKEALGSVHYISPEQAKGGRVDNRSDIYSLGVVMYEMMTGRPPYDGESPVSVAIQHINGKAVMPSTLNPNIPGGLEQIIMKAMAQEPGKRYATAQAMLYDMDEFRKDPSILFDYHNTSTGIDDATMIAGAAAIQQAAAQQAARTTAERVAAKSGDAPVRRTAAASQNKKQTAQRRRRAEEIVEDDEKSNKAATVAVVVCSVVAIIAIAIFLVTLLGGAGGSDVLISAPKLVGTVYDEQATYTDYTIQVDKYVYSEEYEKGVILEQNPVAGTQISKGGVITVVVSSGTAPGNKMVDLLKVEVEYAKNYLMENQGVDESRILILYEASSEVDKGCVIRTDPVVGEDLPENGPIYLIVSTGPAEEGDNTVTMIDLTLDYYDVETAEKWLTDSGFADWKIEYVTNDKAAGKIVSQSVSAGREVTKTTVITLWVSLGNGGGGNETVPPGVTIRPEDYVAKMVEITLPEDYMDDYVLRGYCDDELGEERDIPMGTISAQFQLYGKGTMEFRFVINGSTIEWTEEVNFDEP